MNKERFSRFRCRGRVPEVFLGLAMALLCIAWLAVWLVDGLNALGLQSWAIDRWWRTSPFLWYQLFSEASPIENLQWAFLSGGCVVSVLLFRAATRANDAVTRRMAFFWACGLLLMVAEDSLNIRHLFFSNYLAPAVQGGGLDREYVRLFWELAFYAGLSVFMFVPLYLYWRQRPWGLWWPRRLFLAYAVYALVGFGSAARRVGDWQERLGEWLIAWLDPAGMPSWDRAFRLVREAHERDPESHASLGYLLVDHLVEESVEYIAAALLLSGLLVVWGRYWSARCQSIR